MGVETAIAWTDHTFNIAWGCFKVSPGCKNCYADTFATNRAGLKLWGPPETTARRTFSAKHWQDPIKWNAAAQKAGQRRRVFCSSMCDIFEDHPTIIAELAKLWPIIRATPWLEWQLLTKRYDRIAESLPADWGEGYANVWLGVSTEDHKWASLRIWHLLQVPARVHWISYEPALGAIDFTRLARPTGGTFNALDPSAKRRLAWIIYGGESGANFRRAEYAWPRDARDQCRAWSVPYFHKQSNGPRTEMGIELDGVIIRQYPNTGDRSTPAVANVSLF